MPLNVEGIRRCLKEFDFRTLFVQELGWDKHSANLTVAVDSKTYQLHALAEKRGFQVFECPPSNGGTVPDHLTRSKIERQVAKSAHEHIIIYTDSGKTVQKWQWVRRELGRPLARREYDFFKGHTGELLAQKLQYLAVDLAEEERITLPDVRINVKKAFDVDRLTKRFYDRFKTEHATFLQFIKGITAVADAEWYASLMLNRLMFIYFIQKKGFLDGDNDYLRNRLRRVQAERGKDKFLTFYRYFLLRLFHEGLGQPQAARKKDLDKLLGNVPYLNGGLFDVHDLERAYTDIRIADEAFERLFAFFDAYQWHLDERPLRADNEINPDVLGYIFEKYINQKQMGAYYTKEDITGYISHNTLIPFLFNAAEKKCAIAFQPDSALWRLLCDDPDRYLYPAMRKGVDVPLPEEIDAGTNDVSKRGSWNKAASEEYALPTETWREHIARRQRCHDLRAKLKAGAIHDINDFITYNLDICQLAEDAIDNSEGPDLLRAFYHALSNVSVLDPACGSGAFLFAALNLLEPLYEACLERMHGFLDDLKRNGAKHHPQKFSDFRKILEDVERHPNRRYFILKSIIVGNLYGVDIMEEAVEICKLRLFLKLVAQVEKVEQIEPLPDIDFNVRAGNTLVGFASLVELEALRKTRLSFDAEEVMAILEDARQAEQSFAIFRRLQLQYGAAALDYSEAKTGLQTRLANLRNQLDLYLAAEYGVDTEKPKAFQKWKESHKPFHWFAEFYGIMSQGGFDVIIGNPPYVEYSKVRSQYQVHAYKTLPCANIYTFFVERCLGLISPYGRSSLIVPLSLLCTDRMAFARKQLADNRIWIPSFDIRPSSLFEGVSQRLCIFITAPRTGTNTEQVVGGYRRWATQERPSLIPLTAFTDIKVNDWSAPLPKIALPIESCILAKISGSKLTETIDKCAKPIYIHRICRYFIKALDFIPHFIGADGSRGKSEDYKAFTFRNANRTVILCLINSSLFYWFWRVHGDGFHCGYGDVYFMPFNIPLKENHAEQLASLHCTLMKSLKDNSSIKKISTKRGSIEYQEFYPKDSKPIMDEIDRVLAKHYGFTDEELDFILNYDIKYRMGQDGGDEEE